MEFLRRLFGRTHEGADLGERLARLEAEVGELRAALAESEWLAQRWQQELERARGVTAGHVAAAIAGAKAELLRDLGDALGGLVDGGNGVAAQCRGVLARHGVMVEGGAGVVEPFDAGRHRSSGGERPPGQSVTLAGVRLVMVDGGAVVRKAPVE